MIRLLFLHTFLLVAICNFCFAEFDVWPVPQHISIIENENKISISKNFRFVLGEEMKDLDGTTTAKSRLTRAIDRFNGIFRNMDIRPLSENLENTLEVLEIHVEHGFQNEEYPSSKTDYHYNLMISDGVARAYANSQYGAFYAMETFIQMLSGHGDLAVSEIEISDGPQNDWRGLMIDAGRRFFPVATVKNLLDVMSMVKLNVLHLHASDHCRFGVESKLYPNLTSSLAGDYAGFYTQEDIRNIIEYAADRGIRVVPEFDVPGHSRGFFPLASEGVKFCSKDNDQLYGDPEGSTLKVISELLKEMAGLFKDEVFNIGADETTVTGPCTLDSTFEFERKLLTKIESEFNKTPEGWEEILFTAKAATNDTVVNSWSRHTASEIVDTGRKAVESHNKWFYFTDPAGDYPQGWQPCWNDIAAGINEDSRHLLLGGEISMWTDRYCIINQCLNTHKTPPGHSLFPPEKDAEFQISVGGMIWPRGFVAAGAFWGYDKSIDSQSQTFQDKLWKLNDMVIERGGATCPTKCACDFLEQCGKPISG